MIHEEKYDVIIGAGLPALIVALKLKSLHPKRTLFIVEREQQIGGLYSSINYPPYGEFDFGMHVLYETGIAEIDKFIEGILPPDQWNYLEGNCKDIAGIFFNGRLQTYSPYVDLRTLPASFQQKAMSDFFLNLNSPQSADPTNAMDHLRKRYGPTIALEVFSPILRKLYRESPEYLDLFATRISAMDRIILFDENIMHDLMKSDLIRSRIAFPNQMNLSERYRTNGTRGLYPKTFGLRHMINFVKKSLESTLSVHFLLGATTSCITTEHNRINSLEIRHNGEVKHLRKINRLYWTAPLHSLANLLEVETKNNSDKSKIHAYRVNLLFNKPVQMSNLYYFYCYDDRYSTFRVTNYTNYCLNAASSRGCPICVEFWPKIESEKNENSLIKAVLDELTDFEIINNSYQLIFSRVEPLHAVPSPTIENMRDQKALRQAIDELGLSNLTRMGIMSEDNIFFFPDVMRDSFRKLTE